MHPLETAAGVPAFLAKLWRLVEDKETNDLISWSSVRVIKFHEIKNKTYFSRSPRTISPKKRKKYYDVQF